MQGSTTVSACARRRCLLPALLAAALALVGAAPGPGSPAAEKFSWQLSDPRVVDPGETTTTPRGTMITAYTVEATARGVGQAPIQHGRFRLTINYFSPTQDLPGQEAGFWYGTGTWILTDQDTPADPRARYGPGILRGSVRTKLAFHPTRESGPVEAQVEVVTFRPGRGRQKGGGTFTGDEKFAGTLVLDLQLFTPRRPVKGEAP